MKEPLTLCIPNNYIIYKLYIYIQIEHNIVKNPNWPEANHLAIYKRGRGFELGATEKQIQVVVREGLEPGTAGSRVRHADHLTTLALIVLRPTDFALKAKSCSFFMSNDGLPLIPTLLKENL